MSETTTRPPAAPKPVPSPGAMPNPGPPPSATPAPAAAPPQPPAQTGPGTSPTSSLQRLRANAAHIMAKGTDIGRADNKPFWATWHVKAPAEHTVADVTTPYYLWNRNESFTEGDHYFIRHALNHYLVEGMILAIDKATQSITSKLIAVHDLTTLPVITGDFTGATILQSANEWVVQRGNVCLSPRFKTQAACQQWLSNQQLRVEQLKATKAA